MTRLFAAKISDLPPGECKRIEHEPPIALYRVGDEYYATADWCSHDKASLSEGWLDEDCTIECPWHAAKFDIRTGAALSAPASAPVRTFRVEIAGEEVFILLD